MTHWPMALLFCSIDGGLVIWVRVIRERLKRSHLWPSVRGSVTKSQVRSRNSGNQSGYVPELEYSYRVGREYLGRTINLGFEPHRRLAAAEEYCASHPVGSELEAFYDPSNPSNSCLDRRDSLLWIFELVGLSFVLVVPLMCLGHCH